MPVSRSAVLTFLTLVDGLSTAGMSQAQMKFWSSLGVRLGSSRMERLAAVTAGRAIFEDAEVSLTPVALNIH